MFTSVAQANAAVIEQIRRARPHWLDAVSYTHLRLYAKRPLVS